jgi:uncharacterized protein (TIGR03086 family)
MNVVELDRKAVLRSVDIVASVTPQDLSRPTPCAAWTLEQLLVHMIREHRGFAAAAAGETSDVSVWDDQPLGDDPAAAYADAAHAVVAAFAGDGVLAGTFWLPKVASDRTFPARQAISFHLLDYVVHGWDVAATLGQPRTVDDELVEATLRVARLEVPDRPQRALPGASFRTALPPVDGESPQQRMLRLLGRDPDWTAS